MNHTPQLGLTRWLTIIVLALSWIGLTGPRVQAQPTELPPPAVDAQPPADLSGPSPDVTDSTLNPSAIDAEQEPDISLAWTIPFVLLLASIALMPFIHKHWWEHYYPLVALVLAGISAFHYFVLAPSSWPWLHEMAEYISFIALLGSLYIVSGGIIITVRRKATPVANVVLLLIGAVIANIFGTTGAAMLLIRPYLKMNRNHIKPYHIIFFIFLVANVGGAVTPIGDPPLFLGYLYGVPFWWVLEHCREIWGLAVIALLVIFFVIDSLDNRRQFRRHDGNPGAAVGLHGVHNFLFVGIILFAVFQQSVFEVVERIHHDGMSLAALGQFIFSREVLMVLASVGSRLATSRAIYRFNAFSYGPIREVAILFIGIFSTMVPALQWLGVHAGEMPLKTPGQYYFTSGSLSAVLDNAPTYLTFLKVKLSTVDPQQVRVAEAELARMRETSTLKIAPHLEQDVHGAIQAMVTYHPNDILKGSWTRNELQVAFLIGDAHLNLFLVAVSIGAVFFGACTYIGNGPNFMVKSIAESAGIQTPGFLAYIIKYSLPILVPLYILVWWIFFSGWQG